MKNLLNLGKALSKQEQQSIGGGSGPHLLCPYGSEGEACIIYPSGKIGQCNSLGICG